MSTIALIGLDLAKSIFQLHGEDSQGNAVLKKRLTRAQLAEFFAQLEPCIVAMEACGSAHYWARKLTALGHQPKLIPPQYVKPFVKTNKNDAADAAAIATAARQADGERKNDGTAGSAVYPPGSGWLGEKQNCNL